MQHCGIPYYAHDKFCGHCGEELPRPTKKSITQVSPELIKKYRADFPKSKVLTGEIASLDFYQNKIKRNKATRTTKKNGNETTDTKVVHDTDHTYSLWAANIVDEKGEIHECTMSAESDATSNLKVGDVVTIINKGQGRLHYAEVVTVHYPDRQTQFIDEDDLTTPVRKPQFWFQFALVPSLIGFIYYFFTASSFTEFLPVVAFTPLVALIEYLVKESRAKTAKELHSRKLKYYEEVLNVTRESLGYLPNQRVRSISDVLCPSCTTRNDAKSTYCTTCGNSMVRQPEPEPEPVLEEIDSGDVAVATKPQTEVIQSRPEVEQAIAKEPLPIQAIMSALGMRYDYNDKVDYSHRLAYSSNIDMTLQNDLYLAQVLEVDITNEVNASVSTKTDTKRETIKKYERIYRGPDDFFGEQHVEERDLIEVTSFVNDTRSSDTYQELTVVTMFGKLKRLYLGNSVSDVAEGDWIAVKSHSKLPNHQLGSAKTMKKPVHVLESIYNITKNKTFRFKGDFTSYKSMSAVRTASWMWFPALLSGLISPYIPGLFVAWCCYGMLVAAFQYPKNKADKEKALIKVNEAVRRLKEESPKIRDTLYKIT